MKYCGEVMSVQHVLYWLLWNILVAKI